MLKRLISHGLHLLGEAAIGAVALAGLAACVLAWRLAQGPIDVSQFLARAHPMMVAGGAQFSAGQAALAWEGFESADQPLDVRLSHVDFVDAANGLVVHVPQLRASLALGPLLLGHVQLKTLFIDGASVQISALTHQEAVGGAAQADVAKKLRAFAPPPWLAQLRHVVIRDAAVTLAHEVGGLDMAAPHVSLEATRLRNGGVAGYARADIVAGAAQLHVDAAASVQPDGTHFTLSTSPVAPALLAQAAPALGVLAGVDVPVRVAMDATLDTALLPRKVMLHVATGAGSVAVGSGHVGISNATASLSLVPGQVRLEALRVALAPLPAPHAAPPVIVADAASHWAAGKIQTSFNIAIDAMAIGDLGAYWPPGVGGGSRGWLTQNLPAGRARDAHVSGALEMNSDFSGASLSALSGGMDATDLTIFWLRPIPPLEHGTAHLTVEGPDSLLVTMQGAAQGALHLESGSSIRFTGLSGHHQFGDIDVHLAGSLADTLALLNHPRLNLLARGGLEILDPAGDVAAGLRLHLPLEARVTMDDISIAANAALSDVHLGKVAGGYDIDQANLALQVDNHGLSLSGKGRLGPIDSSLSLAMDFRDGPGDQVLQHAVAHGVATPGQLALAGLPAAGGRILTGGTAALALDYSAHRDGLASLRVEADLTKAALQTPVGWTKDSGKPATMTGVVRLSHGHLLGIDQLQAQGPDLLIDSHEITGPPNHLVLDKIILGKTQAQGDIIFPAAGDPSLQVNLSGDRLDLSFYAEPPAKSAAPPRDDADDDAKPGTPWSANLNFAQLQLGPKHILQPFSAVAASDGLRISHAHVVGGQSGELAADITPFAGGRRLMLQAKDAGAVLRALGVVDNIGEGTLHLDGNYDDRLMPSKLTGTAKLTDFNLQSAPAIGLLLQAMTLYGLADVLRGPGLHFSNLVAPFTWQRRVLHLTNGRAFSPSLGITAAGDIDMRRHTAEVTGTLVPAYFFNQLLGDLPIVGQIFSPEKGGGVFAARYSVTGPLANPKIGVNPLAALTPGFLREGFGLLSPPAKKPQ